MLNIALMKFRYGFLYGALCSALLFAIPNIALSQAVNYIDESGNIYFADSIRDVPHRYRSQLITPTPWPLDKRGKPIVPKKSREQIQAERDKERAKKLAEATKQRERNRILAEQEKRRNSVMRLEQRVPKSKFKIPDSLMPGTAGNDTEVAPLGSSSSPNR